MISAKYGKNDTYIDVTNNIYCHFETNNVMKVGNSLFGDPLYGVKKELIIIMPNNAKHIYLEGDTVKKINTLPERQSIITEIINNVEHKTYPFITYKTVNQRIVDPHEWITIVMTTHDRQEQTLHTLNTFQKSQQVNRIIVILVDDSQYGFFGEQELKIFSFPITYITIQHDQKTWLNPCVNYNIGFQEIQTDYVIIQNAEVCHCGDIIQHVHDHLTIDNYLVYDVCSIGNPNLFVDSLSDNHEFYQYHTYSDIYQYITQKKFKWFQHWKYQNHNLHFLTAIMHCNLTQLRGFDYDYSLGGCVDDKDFVYRIVKKIKLQIVNVHNEHNQIMGIHQWHHRNPTMYDSYHHTINKRIFERKHGFDYSLYSWSDIIN